LEDDLHILIKGCIRYNRLSQEKLYKRFYPDLFMLCNKFLDDEQDIITALNNGMMNVFNNIEKYDAQKGDFYGWIYCIVRNSALSVVRTKQKEIPMKEIGEVLQLDVSSNPLANEAHKVSMALLGRLPTGTRAVINLFYLEGYLIKEIAESLDMKEGTVKWHLNEGRSKLKQMINGRINKQVYAK